MNDFKFTWSVQVDGTYYTREEHKNFEKLISSTPFVLNIRNIETNESFHIPITKNMKPIFYRRVYGKCELSTMHNEVVKYVYVFGYEENDIKHLTCEVDGKYYKTNDDEALVTWE